MKKKSVMIVDDSETDRYLLKRFLGKTEMIGEVIEADDGKSALKLLQNFKENKQKYPDAFPPSFIFLDINMPDIGGFKFLEEYKLLADSIGELSIAIMILSSSTNEEEKNKAFSYPFVKGFLVKGAFRVEDLKEKILSLS